MATIIRNDKTEFSLNGTSINEMPPRSTSIIIFGRKREPEADFHRVLL